MMARKFMSAALVAGMLVVAACNTVSGAGQDLQSASEAGKNVIN